MSSLNKVMLIGNLGADPEIRSFNTGGRVANLKVATSEIWRDKATGERKERTEWHNVAVTGDRTVEYIQSYATKGDKVYVEGKLQTKKWQDKQGNDRYTTEICVGLFGGDIKIISSKQKQSSENQPITNAAVNDIDDDIPF